MRLRAGTVDGALLLFGALIHHGVEIKVFDCAEGLFDETTTTEPPGGSDDFGGEDFFEGAIGGEFAPEGFYGAGVFVFFAFGMKSWAVKRPCLIALAAEPVGWVRVASVASPVGSFDMVYVRFPERRLRAGFPGRG